MSNDIQTRAYYLWEDDVRSGIRKGQYWYYMEAMRIDRLLKQGLYRDAPLSQCSTCTGPAKYCCRVCYDSKCANHMHPMTCRKCDTSVPTDEPMYNFWDPSSEESEEDCCGICCQNDQDYEDEELMISWDDHSIHRPCLCVPTREEPVQKTETLKNSFIMS